MVRQVRLDHHLVLVAGWGYLVKVVSVMERRAH